MSDLTSVLPEAWRAALVESSLDGVILMDARGIVVDVNRAVEETFGTSKASVVGRRLAEVFVPPELRARHEGGLRRYLATGESAILGRRVEVEALHADGSRIPVELSIVQLQGTAPALFVGHLRNIASRVRSDRRLRLSAAAAQAVAVSTSPKRAIEGVLRAVGEQLQWPLVQFWRVDPDSGVVAMVHTWSSVPGLPEAIPAPLLRRGEGLPGHAWATGEAIWFDDIQRDEFVLPRRDALQANGIRAAFAFPVRVGGDVVAVVEAFRIAAERRDPELIALLDVIGGQLGHVVAMHEARMSLQASEHALRDALDEARRANASKDHFLAMLSHELRTPLQPIMGWAVVLQRAALDEPTRLKAAEAILRNAQLETRLVEDLLDVSRIVTGKLTIERVPLSLVAVLQSAIEAVAEDARRKGVALRFDGEFEVPLVLGDTKRLHQVFSNLLVNAVKFTPSGGEVAVTIAVTGASVEISVHDTGVGISSDLLPRIFERFRQGGDGGGWSSGGLGLGLSIVRDLVIAHGGAVDAQSEGPGKGATFVVRLPRAATAAP